MVARTAGGREVAGSSPVTPTSIFVIIGKYSFVIISMRGRVVKLRQHVFVIGLAKQNGKMLLAKDKNGTKIAQDVYDLPLVSIREDEQPEDSVKRLFAEQVGMIVGSSRLVDALALVDDPGIGEQKIVLIYEVSNLSKELGTKLNRNCLKWVAMSNIHHDMLTPTANTVLGSIDQLGYGTPPSINSVIDTTKVVIYSDGGSRGNPGPSAAGYVVYDTTGVIISKGGVYIGLTTNNQAEYHGVRIGLEKALELGASKVDYRLDSMLVANQLKGIYKIKNRELWPIYERIKELISEFEKVTFVHVKREQNMFADEVVNNILNQHTNNRV